MATASGSVRHSRRGWLHGFSYVGTGARATDERGSAGRAWYLMTAHSQRRGRASGPGTSWRSDSFGQLERPRNPTPG